VLGNSDSTAYIRHTDVSVFPDYGHNLQSLNGTPTCRRPGCRQCASSAEAATVHLGCFQLVRRECGHEILDRLWVEAAWRSPWRHAPHLHLPDMNVALDISAAKALGLSGLRLLPLEMIQWIRSYSVISLLWRLSSARALASRLSAAAAGSLVSIPARDIPPWRRGDTPAPVVPSRLPVIRLKIDSRGIEEVERLQKKPPYKVWRSDQSVFVLLEESCLEGARVHFKVLASVSRPRSLF